MVQLLQAYTQASQPQERARLREQISRAARALLVLELERAGLQAADAEDEAHKKIQKVLDILLDHPPDSPEAYLKKVARHAAIGLRRHQGSRAYLPPVDPQEHKVEQRLVAPDEQGSPTQALLDCIEAILARPEGPAVYRCVLDAHYLWGIPLDVIVCHELWERGIQPPGSTAEQRKARATIDQRMTRARHWLKQQAERCCKEWLP